MGRSVFICRLPRLRGDALAPAGKPNRRRLLVPLLAISLTPRVASGVATNEPIACDTALTRSIDDPSEADRFTFTVAEGERVAINVVNAAPATNFSVQWRLLTGAGAPAASCGGFNDARAGGQLRDCGPLPASGNPYQIEVRDQFSDGTGTYLTHVQRLAADVACESMPTCLIDPQVESDLVRFKFVVTDGQTVAINVVNGTPVGSNFSVQWRLLTGAGAPAASCGGFNDARAGGQLRDCASLPVSGNPYQIEVRDQFSDGMGAYRVSIDGVLQCVTTTTTTTTTTTLTFPSTTTTTTTTTTSNTTSTTTASTTTSTLTTSSTVATSTTTSTSLPPDSCDVPDGPTFVSIGCRLDALLGRIAGETALGDYREKLARPLQDAAARLDEAVQSCGVGNLRRAKTQLKRAGHQLVQYAHRLSGRRARKRLSPTLREELLALGGDVRDDMMVLRRAVRCPEDSPSPEE